MKITAIIPGRYSSSRLPGKPLVDIAGRPMIVRVADRASLVASIARIIIATDDQRIFDAVSAAGYEAMMTSAEHATGTDRLSEVAARLDDDVIVNIQGDEPLIEPSTIEAAIAALSSDPSVVMSTTCEPVESAEDIVNPNVVKVVTDDSGFAIYFSRSPIPYPRPAVQRHGSLEAALAAEPALLALFAKHTGMYAYRRRFLLEFARMKPTPLERTEALEQLRALENGYRIRVVRTTHRSIGVDTPEDLERVRGMFA